MVRQVLVTAGDAEHPLSDELFHRVPNQVRVPMVLEAGRELLHQPEPPVCPVKQRQATVGRDVLRVERCDQFPPPNPVELDLLRVTLCFHGEGPPDGWKA
jgi:hypothetical protein